MCFLIFTTTLFWNTILIIFQRDIVIIIIIIIITITMYVCFCVNYPLLYLDLIKIEFSLQILKNIQIINFVNIRPVEAELFHEDEQTAVRT
jgi:hypothetical protein